MSAARLSASAIFVLWSYGLKENVKMTPFNLFMKAVNVALRYESGYDSTCAKMALQTPTSCFRSVAPFEMTLPMITCSKKLIMVAMQVPSSSSSVWNKSQNISGSLLLRRGFSPTL